MTAREIIEARLGRKLPPTRDLPPDLRRAVMGLAIELIRSNPTAAALRAAAQRRLAERTKSDGGTRET